MTVIPIMIDLEGKRVVIVGGGRIAERRLDSLLDNGAVMIVISPSVTPEISRWAEEGKMIWKQQSFEPTDAEDAFMIIIATDDLAVNAAARKAAPPHCLVNASAEAESGNIHFPAHFKRGKLSIAVSTNGASPMLAKKIKHELKNQFDERYEQYLEFLFNARQLLKQIQLSRSTKEEYLRAFLDESFLQSEAQQQTLRELRLLVNRDNDFR
ncbi:precorrin-2 dehydrogenase [Planococcus antarcticus DSM 14505]|uniref:precorrin-2 dehydrogenase n=1 Tax=Planococcus antarcticus DSM 14505 TaxID=1185653 RepID=A0AA87IPE3_9BACL|nr:NAD(P)-binding protein [Planococcus antarcticus]EIM08057.1 precorrin-2 dehydrogenase [Planococcus antarcticus DSM 14505]